MTRAWVAIGVIGAGTYAIRASLILLLRGVTVPHVAERAFRYVGPAVLSAIAAQGLVSVDYVSLAVLAPRVLAAIVTGLVAWRTQGLLSSMVAGMTVFLGLDLLIGGG